MKFTELFLGGGECTSSGNDGSTACRGRCYQGLSPADSSFVT